MLYFIYFRRLMDSAQKRILIFDFDGTLADTQDLILAGYNAYAAKRGYPAISPADLPEMREAGARENFKKYRIPLWRIPIMVWHIRRATGAGVRALAIDPDVKTALEQLKRSGHELYIVSSNSQTAIKGFLRTNGLDIFTEVHSVFNLWGKGAYLTKLIKRHRWDRSHVFYIGDEIRDIEAAHKAGISCIAVGWGYNTGESMLRQGASRLLLHKSELKTL